MYQPFESSGSHIPRHGLLLAIDVGGTKTHVACYDIASGQLRSDIVATHAEGLQGVAALERILDAARACAEVFRGAPLLSVAAVFPGVIQGNTLLMAPNTPGLDGLDLHGLIVRGLGCPSVLLDNDVKAGALAEARWGALVGIDDAIYLNLGTGLSAAAIVNGRLLRGHNGAAMEIGYLSSPFLDSDEQDSWRTHAEGAAPLEELFSGNALGELAQQMLGEGHQALDLFSSHDAAVRRALHERITACAVQVANIAVALDVECIAIGGGLFRQASLLEPIIKQLIGRIVPFAPQVVAARFAQDAPLWGALSMAMDAANLDRIDLRAIAATVEPVAVP
ncbi:MULTISPECIES: ROK family protein [Pseudomonas]|uniref:ROK family protein n=1 Tax=Pseudomonas TaxID=286 RepID=UPI001BE82B5B|nr:MULTISPECIES: ROK family protein [Pseudomonas]MBT2339986.1 ROK family protein [Pseudomonas fluorescens]MCD4527862.1 ROK family protein [Pseudomonas sp. C3-2018]